MEWRNAGEPSLTLCLLGLFKWPFDDGDDHVREPSPTLCLPELFKWPFPVNGQLNFPQIQTFSIFFPYDGFLLQFFFSGKAGSLLKLKMKIMRGRTSAFVEDISNMRLVEMKKRWKLIELKKSKTNYFVACRCLDGALNTSALRVSEKIDFGSCSPIFLGDLSLFY